MLPEVNPQDQLELLLLFETAQQRVALHRGTEIAEIAQVPQIPQVAQIAEVWLVSVISDLVETDELVRERRGVLVAGGAGRNAGGRGRGRRLLRRVERLVEIRP